MDEARLDEVISQLDEATIFAPNDAGIKVSESMLDKGSLETWIVAESFFLSTEMPPIFPQNWTLICDFKVFIINKKSFFTIST